MFHSRFFLAIVLLVPASLRAAEEPAFTVVSVVFDKAALAGAHDVELQGNYAFVAGKGSSLAIIDVADPKQPRIVWHRQDSKAFDDAETVLPAGGTLFVGTRDFVALDIRDPRNAKVTATIADRKQVERINGMVKCDDLILAANKYGRVNGFDVSSPEKPKLVAALDVATRDEMKNPHDIDLWGDHFVIVDPAGFGRRNQPGQLGVYRFKNALTKVVLPPEKWSLEGKVKDQRLAGANRVRRRRAVALAACSISPQATDSGKRQGSLVAVDLLNTESPSVIATVPFPDKRGPNGMELSGRVAFVSGGQTIMAVDVSNPRKPVMIAAQQLKNVFPAGDDDGHDLVYRDGYLYVTGQTSNSFGVLKVNSEHIRELAGKRN